SAARSAPSPGAASSSSSKADARRRLALRPHARLAMRGFPRRDLRGEEELMRVTLLRAGLVGGLFTLVACGGGSEKTAATTTTTAAMKPTGTTAAPAAQEEEYELDVIAEAEPDE